MPHGKYMTDAPCPPPREPSRPIVPTPPNACDTHCHVFGPAARFPYAADRSYTPPDAPLAKYLALLDTLGFDARRAGAGQRARARQFRDARRAGARAEAAARRRGRGSPTRRRPNCAAGMRSACAGCASIISSATGNCTIAAACRSRPRSTLAPVMKELGWHLQLWIDVKDLPDTIPILKEIGLPVVIDHMGRTDAQAGTSAPGFQSLLRLLGEGGCWVKLSGAHRVSQRGAGLSGRARAARGAGRRKSRAARVGLRLAASAHGRRDAERRPPARPVQRMDAGRRDPPAHPGRQSGAGFTDFSALSQHRYGGQMYPAPRRALEAADQLRKEQLRQIEHDVREQHRERDGDEEHHIDRQRREHRRLKRTPTNFDATSNDSP